VSNLFFVSVVTLVRRFFGSERESCSHHTQRYFLKFFENIYLAVFDKLLMAYQSTSKTKKMAIFKEKLVPIVP